MIIGIIGAGSIGATLAQQLVSLGHEVYISNSRGPDSLAHVEAATGAKAATTADAAERGELVIEAIPFGRYRDLPASALANKIVVTAANYFPGRDGTLDFQGHTQSELFAHHLVQSKLVKAFSTIYWQHLRDQPNPKRAIADRRVIPLAGDDPDARQAVADLITALGFGPLDLGGLRAGGTLMEPGALLFNQDLTVAQARALVEQSQ